MSAMAGSGDSSEATPPPAVAVGVRRLSKEYPGVRALMDVSFDVEVGQVHALVGENGAGKSTLISLIAGTNRPSAGGVEIDGTLLPALTPRLARSLGIRLVPQERQVCPDISVGENVMLGRPPKRWGRLGPVDHAAMHREARRRLAEVGLEHLDPRERMRGLSAVQTQLVEIARALSANARLVIMDEPTAALGGADVQTLFQSIDRLRRRGVSFLYVSHHLEEIFQIADVITVLRDGRHVETRPVAGLTMEELVRLLLGRSPEEIGLEDSGRRGTDVLLEAEDVHRRPNLHGVSLRVHAGEVLAITGGIGSGRRELARALVGVDRPEHGEVRTPGGGRLRGPAHAVRQGIAFLPEDRKREGVLGALTVSDNIGLGRLAMDRSPLSRPRRRQRDARAMVERLRVKTPSIHQPARLLSGGNQQKALLGRWLNVGVRALVLDGPTEGIDIGSRIEIYTLLRNLASEGMAVVILTSDFEEVKLVADRVLCLRRGRVAGELTGGQISEERLYALQYGTNDEGVVAA
jgi:ABC-type sugar transport system ATPase subunit